MNDYFSYEYELGLIYNLIDSIGKLALQDLSWQDVCKILLDEVDFDFVDQYVDESVAVKYLADYDNFSQVVLWDVYISKGPKNWVVITIENDIVNILNDMSIPLDQYEADINNILNYINS